MKKTIATIAVILIVFAAAYAGPNYVGTDFGLGFSRTQYDKSSTSDMTSRVELSYGVKTVNYFGQYFGVTSELEFNTTLADSLLKKEMKNTIPTEMKAELQLFTAIPSNEHTSVNIGCGASYMVALRKGGLHGLNIEASLDTVSDFGGFGLIVGFDVTAPVFIIEGDSRYTWTGLEFRPHVGLGYSY